MARPTSKVELLEQSATNFSRLLDAVDALTPDQQQGEFPFEDRDRNVRDVLAHLHEWHLMMLGWYETGMAGNKPQMPAPGFTWKTLPALNAEIWERYQNVSLANIRERLGNSHNQLQAIIESHSNDELFEKKRYTWTGSTSLGSYLISATSSHYDWALKKLRKYSRACLAITRGDQESTVKS